MSLDNYEDVDTRLHRFHAKHPTGRVLTELVHTERLDDHMPLQYIVRAELYTDQLIATGWAEEIVTKIGVNKTSALENCETSAIGRALANAGFSAKGSRPSRQEMEKVARLEIVTPTAPDTNDPWAVSNAVEAVKETFDGTVVEPEHPDRIFMHQEKASVPQMNLVRKLMAQDCKNLEVTELDYMNALLSDMHYSEVTDIYEIGKKACSLVIDKLKS